jgi:acetyl esterase/lipase
MLRGLLLLPAVALLVLGLFTVVKAPDWSPWKLAVLAGEFGHWLAPAALALAGLAVATRAGAPVLAGATAGTTALAAALLLVPTVQAWRIGRALPAQLAAQFGPWPAERAAFSPLAWFGRDPAPVPVTTLEVAPGLPLDFYRAVRSDGRPAPCVVVVHGGGWDSGDRTQLPGLNHWLARQGYAVAAISYRLAPKAQWPAPREDTLAALALLKARAGELGLDAGRFVLLGRSAGGQIAQATGYTAGDPAIRGVIGLYAPSDLIFGYVNTHENDMLKSPALMRQFLGGTPESARAAYASASAIYHVTPRTPPTLLLHGTIDALVWYRHSERLDAKLAEHGVPRLHVAMPWATHAFDYNLRGPGGQLTTFALAWYLARVTAA